MTSSIQLEDGAPRVRMGRRERNGLIFGLSGLQVFIASAALSAGMMWMFIDASSFWGNGFLPVILIVIFAVCSYQRESIALLTFKLAAYYLRVATGQNMYVRDIRGEVEHVTMKLGKVPAGRAAPERIGHFDLPGASASVATYQTDRGGAFTLDQKQKTAAFTLDLTSGAWPMKDPSQQEAAYDGFVAWLSSLETIVGLTEMTLRVRVDAQPATELAEYVVMRENDMGDSHNISDELRQNYWKLIQAGAGRSMGFSNQVTLTFSLPALKAIVRANGGGLWGVGVYFDQLLPSIDENAKRAGLQVKCWMTAADLEAANARAYDPTSFTSRMRATTPDKRLDVLHPPVMGIHEHRDRIEIDGTIHQVLWIAEWPRTERATGFMERLLYATGTTRTLTLQVRPVPTEKALARIARHKTGLEMANLLREKRGMPRSAEKEREMAEVEEREERLADGFADVEFRGFVTISATSREELNRSRTSLEQTARSSGLRLAPMFFQQAAAFTTAVLPINGKG